MKYRLFDVKVRLRTVVVARDKEEVKEYLIENLAEIADIENDDDAVSLEQISEISKKENLPDFWSIKDIPWGYPTEDSSEDYTCGEILIGERIVERRKEIEKEIRTLEEKKQQLERQLTFL